MRLIDIAVLLALAVAVFFAVRSVWKHRGSGCGSCRACDGWRDKAARDDCRRTKAEQSKQKQ